MKVIWICNLVLPFFSDSYGIRPSNFGGWMSESYRQIKSVPSIEISFAFPIFDEHRRRDFREDGVRVYSFDGNMDYDVFDDSYEFNFVDIFSREQPDIIHIWGTEYKHSYYALRAAEKMGWVGRTLVDIQGLVSFINVHYLDGVPFDIINREAYIARPDSLINENKFYADQGRTEEKALSVARFVTGRTEWDHACVKLINPRVKYFHNNRVLRSGFYNHSGNWDVNRCIRNSIFISNASYALKGLHTFLPAVQLLTKEYCDLRVIVAGHNPLEYDSEGNRSQYGDYLEETIKQMGLERIVSFVGILNESEMIEHLTNAHVFVASSTVENSCNSLCEAMMIGTPVVSSFAGGLPSLVEHGTTGFLYQCNAAYMAAYYISKVFDNDECASRLSGNAISAAIKRHDKERVIRNMIRTYKRILE